ncbi:MAG: hypothetical protein MJ107_04185 [Lachnospiraceae bacterium]|nr:hypothetical protein [Lachnospiraceae bacterium]
MRIDSYQIGMDSERLYKSSFSARIKLVEERISGQGSDNPLMSFAEYLGGKEKEENQSEQEETSALPENVGVARDAFGLLGSQRIENMDKISRNAHNEFQKLHQLMIRHIFELLFGRRTDKTLKEEFDETEQPSQEFVASSNMGLPAYEIVSTQYTSSGCFAESEQTKFSALGQVKTSDGRSIDINLNISMSRSFAAFYESNYSSVTLNAIDPLVINFDGNLADLDENMDFYFDLDSDGEEEKLAGLKAGSAFLAIDLNDDGVINDGSELFGTKSGDGFKDLSAYDEDGNGWIDENDAVFSKLKLWAKDENGNDVLYTLKQKDIGALYLGAADTQFSLNGNMNKTMGYVRQTGLFLYENGTAGTMQHIDLVS